LNSYYSFELNSYLIEEKWNANWYKKYLKFTSDYVLENKKNSEKIKLKKNLFILLYLRIG